MAHVTRDHEMGKIEIMSTQTSRLEKCSNMSMDVHGFILSGDGYYSIMPTPNGKGTRLEAPCRE